MPHYMRPDKLGPSRWLALESWILGRLASRLPQERCEEWLGDLYEARRGLVAQGYQAWAIVE